MCHYHLHPLQAVTCCRNSRLVVDEDDLKWVGNEKKYIFINKTFHGNVCSKTPVLENEAILQRFMHREGLNISKVMSLDIFLIDREIYVYKII